MIKLATLLLLTVSFSSFVNANEKLEKTSEDIVCLNSSTMSAEAHRKAENATHYAQKAQEAADEAKLRSIRMLKESRESLQLLQAEIKDLKIQIQELKSQKTQN